MLFTNSYELVLVSIMETREGLKPIACLPKKFPLKLSSRTLIRDLYGAIL